MNSMRTRFSAMLTFVYLFAVLLVFRDALPELQKLQANEVGDFLAGIFGPLAFLWLVVGYLQQGEELKQSTAALEQQAFELNNSVKQQELLAKTSMAQLEHLIKLHEDSIVPRIRFDRGDRESRPDGVTALFYQIINNGGLANPLRIEYRTTHANTHGGYQFAAPALTLIQNCQPNYVNEFRLYFVDGQLPVTGEEVIVSYHDAMGRPGERRYRFEWDEPQQNCLIVPA